MIKVMIYSAGLCFFSVKQIGFFSLRYFEVLFCQIFKNLPKQFQDLKTAPKRTKYRPKSSQNPYYI